MLKAKDYLDLDALLSRGKIGLPTALSAAQKIYGPSFNPEVTLKALSYFDDGNLVTLSQETRARLTNAVKAVDLEHLPELDHLDRPRLDQGLEL